MRLSIITINYNNLEGLKKTYESVVCQTWTDYEWIIIDGGSTDGSREFIEEHQDKFTYWCSEPDKGVYNAMNKGIAKAHGEYLNFMNSGDCYYNKNVLGDINQLGSNADIIVGHVVRGDNGEFLRYYDKNHSILSILLVQTLDHQASFIRKALLDKYKYDETLKIVSDWKFWIEAIVFGDASVEYIKMAVAIQDMDGISFRNRLLDQQERQLVLDQLIPHCVREEILRYTEMKSVLNEENVLYLKKNCYSLYLFLRKLTSLTAKIVYKIRKEKGK